MPVELGSCVNVCAPQLRKSRNYIANYQTHKTPLSPDLEFSPEL